MRFSAESRLDKSASEGPILSDSAVPSVCPVLSVIIVTYNSSDVVTDCLYALAPSFEDSIEVIVVDNASSDGTAELVEREFPSVSVIRSPENGGFAGGVEIGVSHAHGTALCLLNPDAVAERATLLELAKRLRIDESLGIVAPVIRQPEGRLQILSAGYIPSTWRMFTHYSGLSRLGRHARWLEGHYLLPAQATAARDVDWVTGACLVISPDAWDRIGGISRRWFMYAEDVELCWRMWRHGYRVRLFPDLEVTHLVGASATGHEKMVNSAWVTNLYDFYAKDIAENGLQRFSWRIIVSVGLISRSVVYGIRGRGGRRQWRRESYRFRVHSLAVLRGGGNT